MIDYSNMTDEEIYNIHGSLPSARIERMFDTLAFYRSKDYEAAIENIENAEAEIYTAPFLETELKELRALAKKVRGDNRDKLKFLIEMLEDTQRRVIDNLKYATSQLEEALEALK